MLGKLVDGLVELVKYKAIDVGIDKLDEEVGEVAKESAKEIDNFLDDQLGDERSEIIQDRIIATLTIFISALKKQLKRDWNNKKGR